MGWIIALIVGGVAGWLAILVMNRDASMGIFWNIVIGCVGSVIGNLIANQFGYAGSAQEFSIQGLVIALIGAIVLLAIVNVIQRSRVRQPDSPTRRAARLAGAAPQSAVKSRTWSPVTPRRSCRSAASCRCQCHAATIWRIAKFASGREPIGFGLRLRASCGRSSRFRAGSPKPAL
ncbi:MAG: GlsB/YeaQ/YmgE family stress response membrane protein [Alphaproteobacteria bacterium]|nr:GlsB/YeaQ/YmgE family stress response membrane protein [Alphaproteobacteria bacterium]